MQPEKFERCIITARQAEEDDKLPPWLVTIGNIAFWLSIMLFVSSFVDAVDLTFR